MGGALEHIVSQAHSQRVAKVASARLGLPNLFGRNSASPTFGLWASPILKAYLRARVVVCYGTHSLLIRKWPIFLSSWERDFLLVIRKVLLPLSSIALVRGSVGSFRMEFIRCVFLHSNCAFGDKKLYSFTFFGRFILFCWLFDHFFGLSQTFPITQQ